MEGIIPAASQSTKPSNWVRGQDSRAGHLADLDPLVVPVVPVVDLVDQVDLVGRAADWAAPVVDSVDRVDTADLVAQAHSLVLDSVLQWAVVV